MKILKKFFSFLVSLLGKKKATIPVKESNLKKKETRIQIEKTPIEKMNDEEGEKYNRPYEINEKRGIPLLSFFLRWDLDKKDFLPVITTEHEWDDKVTIPCQIKFQEIAKIFVENPGNFQVLFVVKHETGRGWYVGVARCEKIFSQPFRVFHGWAEWWNFDKNLPPIEELIAYCIDRWIFDNDLETCLKDTACFIKVANSFLKLRLCGEPSFSSREELELYGDIYHERKAIFETINTAEIPTTDLSQGEILCEGDVANWKELILLFISHFKILFSSSKKEFIWVLGDSNNPEVDKSKYWLIPFRRKPLIQAYKNGESIINTYYVSYQAINYRTDATAIIWKGHNSHLSLEKKSPLITVGKYIRSFDEQERKKRVLFFTEDEEKRGFFIGRGKFQSNADRTGREFHSARMAYSWIDKSMDKTELLYFVCYWCWEWLFGKEYKSNDVFVRVEKKTRETFFTPEVQRLVEIVRLSGGTAGDKLITIKEGEVQNLHSVVAQFCTEIAPVINGEKNLLLWEYDLPQELKGFTIPIENK